MEKEMNKHYLTNRESRAIEKENLRQMKMYEKKKKAKVPESEYISQMKREDTIIEIEDLHTYFFTDSGTVKAVNGVSFDIPEGSVVGVVGESGCGKSVTSLAIMRLVQGPQGQIVSGSIRFKSSDFVYDEKGQPVPVYERDEKGEIVYGPAPVRDKKGNIKTEPKQKTDLNGEPIFEEKNGKRVPVYETDEKGEIVRVPKVKRDKEGNPVSEPVQKCDERGFPVFETEPKVFDIAKMPMSEMRKLRGKEISMIFQEPMTSLNPVFTVGNQLDEAILINNPGVTNEQAKKRSIEMLDQVGIAMPGQVYLKYPHELSGGMRQRVMIAMALSCNPRLIIADEPTTALDVTIQAQILELLKELKNKINGSIMLITHDLGVIAGMADYVVVMYAGRVIEKGTVYDIFDNPLHPYTVGLQKSKPVVNRDVERLYSIPGNVPNPINMPSHCYFKDRCNRCCEKCGGEYPELIQVSETHSVACHLYE